MSRKAIWILTGIVCFLFLIGVAVMAGVFYLVSLANARESFVNGFNAMNRKEYDAAIVDFNAALRRGLSRSLQGAAYGDRGYCYEQKGRIDEAIRDYSDAVRLDPTLNFAWIRRAALYEERGDDEQAIADYTAVLRFNPNSYRAWYRRGELNLAEEHFDDAVADLSEAIRCSPDSSAPYLERGIAYWRKHNRNSALASFDSAIMIHPRFARAYFYRGNLFRDERAYDRAISDYTHAIEAAPKYQSALRARGSVFSLEGRWSEAASDYTAVLKVKPQDTEALLHRGIAYIHLRNYAGAIDDLSALIKLQPTRRAYDYRARAYAEFGDYAHAIADYRQGAEETGPVTTTVKGLAWLLATCPDPSFRNPQEAVTEAREDCERTAWKDWNCLDTLAVACAATRDFEQALKYERLALESAGLTEERRKELRQRLAQFEKHQPYLEQGTR